MDKWRGKDTSAVGSRAAESLRTRTVKGSRGVDASASCGAAREVSEPSFSSTLVHVDAFFVVGFGQGVSIWTGTLHPAFEVDALVGTATVIGGTLVNVCRVKERR